MKRIALVFICVCLSACKASQTPIVNDDSASGPIWSAVGGVYVSRIKDADAGVTCYVSNAGGIDCIKERTE